MIRAIFWGFAARRYSGRVVPAQPEYWMLGLSMIFAGFFGYHYLYHSERVLPLIPLATLLIGVPLVLAFLHQRIRRERTRGRQAIAERYRAISHKDPFRRTGRKRRSQ